MKRSVSIVIPAWNEEERLAGTLQAIKQAGNPSEWETELIVVDDGSTDDTAFIAEPWADRLIRFPRNRGKGAALEAGWKAASFPIVLFLDADLGETAVHYPALAYPVLSDECDMSIAKLPPAATKGGFGFVKRLASLGIEHCSGFQASAPLSGQRAMRKAMLEELPPLGSGFGIEVALTIDAVRRGFRLCEVEVPFRHRETARDWSGFVHRGKQFFAVGRTLVSKWEMKKT